MGTYSADNPATKAVYENSVPAVMISVLSGVPALVSLWAVIDKSVVSTEWVATSSRPVARLYCNDTELCWEAPYKTSTGYGAWTQSTTGPLGVECGSVATAEWYTNAMGLTNGTNKTYAGSISSGYIGITHMVHATTQNAVFGGELDGRTLSQKLAPGKPVQGEIYLVSVDDSGAETLVAATEASVQSQLASSVAVDPASVGGLTGSSAASVRQSLSSWSSVWSRSETVSMAESYGYVSQHCPSDSTGSYVAISAGDEYFSSKSATSLQRFDTTSSLRLMLVFTRPLPIVPLDSVVN